MIEINDYKFSATDKVDGTVKFETFHRATNGGVGDWVCLKRDGTLDSKGRHLPPVEAMTEMQEALKIHLAGEQTREIAAQVAEAAKITLRVKNVGKNRDFSRANDYAKANEGKFDGETKTWVIRIAPEDRANLLRLHSLKEVEQVITAAAAATHSADDIITEITGEDIIANMTDAQIATTVYQRDGTPIVGRMGRTIARILRQSYARQRVSEVPEKELGQIIQVAWEDNAHSE